MKEAQILVNLLRENKIKLSGAESCTGGLVSSLITSVAGSSDVFTGTVVAYSNLVKTQLLRVKNGTIEKYGAVSEETALEMADGAKNIMDADLSYSITGIAGPGGGTPEKPVGTVCFAVFGQKGISYIEHFSGNRVEIREKAALFIINELILLVSSHKLFSSTVQK